MEILTVEQICLQLAAANRDEVIRCLANKLDKNKKLNNKEEYIKAVIARDDLTPTAMGYGIAIPHGVSSSVRVPALAVATLKEKVKWTEKDEVDLVFQIAVPEKNAGNTHLKILAALSRSLMHEEFRDSLRKASSEKAVLELLMDLKKII